MSEVLSVAMSEVLSVAMRGVQAHTSKSTPSSVSLLLLIGICSLRQGKWIEAEDALREANNIDNRFADRGLGISVSQLYLEL